MITTQMRLKQNLALSDSRDRVCGSQYMSYKRLMGGPRNCVRTVESIDAIQGAVRLRDSVHTRSQSPRNGVFPSVLPVYLYVDP